MFISSITIENFRSFSGKLEVNFSSGMNLILGENNAGKSAILEAFALDEVQYNPHLSEKTKPFEDSIVAGMVRVGVRFVVKKEELFRFFGRSILLPIPEQFSSGPGFSNYLKNAPELRFGITFNVSQGGKWIVFSHFVGDLEVSTPTQSGTAVLTYSCEEVSGIYNGGITKRSVRDGQGGEWAPQIKNVIQRIYKFRAERMNIARGPHGIEASLASNSANLAECLNLLQSRNPHLFDEYVRHVRHVFPFGAQSSDCSV